MKTFAGKFYKNVSMNTVMELITYVEKGNLLIDVFCNAEESVKKISIGNKIVDPVTDNEVTLICASTNGFWVKDPVLDKKYLLPLKDTLLYNV